MTKKEYKALRSKYRQSCRELFNRYQDHVKNEFCMSDEAVNLYSAYWEELKTFARLTGQSIPRAADALRMWMY